MRRRGIPTRGCDDTTADKERPDEMRVPIRIKKFFDSYLTEKLDGTGISASCAQFVAELSGDTGMTHKELTERVGVHKSLTTRVVKTLLKEGIIENRGNGKEHSIVLTSKGLELKRLVKTYIGEAVGYLFSDVTPEEQKAIGEIQKKIILKIDEYDERKL